MANLLVAILPFADNGVAEVHTQRYSKTYRVAILPFADNGVAGKGYKLNPKQIGRNPPFRK